MLYRLEIENFYSIRDHQVLDLRIGKNVPDFPERFMPIFPGSAERVAKVVALFGPNGSGKSTVLKALTFLRWFIAHSFQSNNEIIPCERFNDTDSADRLIKLSVEIGRELDISGSNSTISNSESGEFGTFRYEVHLRPLNGLVQTVEYEALRSRPNGKGKWRRVFERSADRAVTGSKSFSLKGYSQVIDKVRSNASVISTLSLFEHGPSKLVVGLVNLIYNNIFHYRSDPTDNEVIKYLHQMPQVLTSLNRELQRIDVGIEGMEIVSSQSGPSAMFRHKGLQLDMPWTLESHGTQAFIRLFPLIALALENGGVAVIDELDSSIHPLVLPEIIGWFYDSERNKHGAQIWMSCHSASLLEDLLKEEVVFCDKDNFGRTKIYSLMDVESVRRDDNLYKKYLGGIYGAVPQIG